MRRSELPPHRSATFVLPRWKVVYVAVPKAACTSLKWLLADLQGENRERFYGVLTREVGRELTIHRRRRWRHTPMLHDLSRDELAVISPDRDWFVFAATRHPSARLWSAWESKLLLREPKWVERFADETWFPRLPKTTADVVDDFARFVRAIAADPDQPLMRDRHFLPQSRLLTPDRTPYTHVYETREIPRLLADLEEHLRANGWEEALTLPPSNASPLRPLPAMFTPEITDAIGHVYAEDFVRFGYERVQPDSLEEADEYDASALRAVARIAERGERIGDLALRAQRLEAAKNAKQREIVSLERELGRDASSPSANGGLVGKVRRTMSRARSRP
jgi:Sulfotransferase family